MTTEQQRALKKLQLHQKGSGYLITDPINKELLNMIIQDALKDFKQFYGRFNKNLLRPNFRSYTYKVNGNMLYIETTYKSGCKYAQSYDMNQFL